MRDRESRDFGIGKGIATSLYYRVSQSAYEALCVQWPCLTFLLSVSLGVFINRKGSFLLRQCILFCVYIFSKFLKKNSSYKKYFGFFCLLTHSGLVTSLFVYKICVSQRPRSRTIEDLDTRGLVLKDNP